MRTIIRVVAFLSPLAAPLVSAYFVREAVEMKLHAPWWIAWTAAFVIEGLGITAIHAALTFDEYNRTRRGAEPPAPTLIAVLLGVGYVVVTILLSVVLKVLPDEVVIEGYVFAPATLALAIFPLVGAIGAFTLALLGQHETRVETVRTLRAARDAERRSRKTPSADPLPTPADPVPTPSADPMPARLTLLDPVPPAERRLCRHCGTDLGDPSDPKTASRAGGHEGNCKANPASRFYDPAFARQGEALAATGD